MLKTRKLPAIFAVLTALVSVLPAAAQVAETTNPDPKVPTPQSVLGHKPGDDFYLANYDESRDYFHKLAASSNRIKLINVGKTTRGLDWEIAIISSPENLAALAAQGDDTAVLLQQMEDSHLRRLWRLTNTLAKVREGALQKKYIANEAGMSMKTKGSSDKVPD